MPVKISIHLECGDVPPHLTTLWIVNAGRALYYTSTLSIHMQGAYHTVATHIEATDWNTLLCTAAMASRVGSE